MSRWLSVHACLLHSQILCMTCMRTLYRRALYVAMTPALLKCCSHCVVCGAIDSTRGALYLVLHVTIENLHLHMQVHMAGHGRCGGALDWRHRLALGGPALVCPGVDTDLLAL